MTDHEMLDALHRRMDQQDKMLLEIDRKITGHMAEVNILRPAIEELVTLWKGSKLLVPILAGIGGLVAWVLSFGKDHIK